MKRGRENTKLVIRPKRPGSEKGPIGTSETFQHRPSTSLLASSSPSSSLGCPAVLQVIHSESASSSHPFVDRVLFPMSLEMFGFRPRIKQPDLAPEEALLLQDLTNVLQIVRQETQHWLYTTSQTTLKALAASDAIVLSLTSALSADDHRIERLINVVQSNDMKIIATAIRCPKTDNVGLKKEKAKLRREIKLLLDRVLLGMKGLSTTRSPADYAKLNIVKEEIPMLLEARRKAIRDIPEEEDFIDEGVVVDQVPDLMYQ